MGRSRNTALILVSQNAGDLLSEQVTNCISSVFAFRSSERVEVANVMALLGAEATAEHLAVLRGLGNGECIFRDLEGRIGRIGVDLISDEMRRWLDTNPTRSRPGEGPPVRDAPVRDAPVRDAPVRDAAVRDAAVRDVAPGPAAAGASAGPAEMEAAGVEAAEQATDHPDQAEHADGAGRAVAAASMAGRESPVESRGMVAAGGEAPGAEPPASASEQ